MSNPTSTNFTCSNGHEFTFIDLTDEDFVPCPECGDEVEVPAGGRLEASPQQSADTTIPTDVSKPKGGMSLWAVMQGGPRETAAEDGTQDSEDSIDVEPSGDPLPGDRSSQSEETPSEGAAENQAVERDDEVDRPRGLWALMGASTAAKEADADAQHGSDEPIHATDPASDEANSRQTQQDWLEDALPGDHDPEERDLVDSEDTDEFAAAEDDGESEDEFRDDEVLEEEFEHDGREIDDPDDIDDLLTPGVPLETKPTHKPRVASTRPTSSYTAISLGTLSTLLSVLSLTPYTWGRYPATLAGLAAIIVGYQGLGECKRSRRTGAAKAMPIAAMLFGVVGMFAGPVYLNELGAELQERALHARITANMLKINEGLDGYHDRHDRFPPGSKHEPDEGGVEIPMHSWMTALLPYIGEDRVVDLIDPSKPFDHDVNFAAMQRVIPDYLVPGVQHNQNHLGFATAHYSGVGGTGKTESGLANLGIFERNSTTSRSEITDGLAQTMIVGEIRTAYPAWGEPDNWRSIGDGLNKQITGFGNVEGNGAHFLMADGRVRFFSNSTDLQVLKALSSRDGGENVQINDGE